VNIGFAYVTWLSNDYASQWYAAVTQAHGHLQYFKKRVYQPDDEILTEG
jgi:hypothetical protein